MQVVECVPNFSEGRDPARVARITDAIAAVDGVTVLHVDPGFDANRTVVTFVGTPDAVAEAAFAGIATAAEVIDMRTQHGTHPRMGATDVCPFIPVEGVTMADCVELARRVGRRVGEELGIPVHLYENAARNEARRDLAVVRRGEYEGLPARVGDPEQAPDFGPDAVHERAGATAIGAREFLIAYNIDLDTRDAALASDIALDLRSKGRVARRPNPSPLYGRGEILRYAEGHHPCGSCDAILPSFDEACAHCRDEHGYDLAALLTANGVPLDALPGRAVHRPGLFAHCKAIGWYLDDYDCAQVSCNLTDHRLTPPHLVLEACRDLAAARGVTVTGSEIVGMVPYQCLLQAGRWYLARDGRPTDVAPAEVLQVAVRAMGLDDVAPFDLASKVLGLPSGVLDAPGEGDRP